MSSARGVIAGLTRFANKGHLARAVLEATAFQTREVLEAMEKDARIRLKVLRADGGMVGERTSDAISIGHSESSRGLPGRQREKTTALGAAYAAGLAVGYYRDTDDLRCELGRRPHLDTQYG